MISETLPTPREGSDFAGEPDGFERLWTPHRWAYISGEEKPADHSSKECPFCVAPSRSDEEGLIVYRGERVFALMNLFPYNSGHLLVCPYRHVPGYVDLTPEEREEFGEVTAQALRVLGASSQPQGFNLGMNQGEVAGAGIAAHLHQHIIPRWRGDANFFPLIARTKAVPELIGQARERLAMAWREAAGSCSDNTDGR
ncbi:MAG: HIT domain-containing protein [Actinomycetaceae bacterium]|nr:HIT domain-containing protein [Actinomycetaceae bacterium]